MPGRAPRPILCPPPTPEKGVSLESMRGTQLRLRHLVGAATLSFSVVLAYLSLASVPAGAQTVAASTSCPVLSVGNPNPGDTIGEGGYVISGEAFDPAATSGSGISRVD